ncbi:MAG: hypothetical protein Q7K35_02790 [bacterium]|nr:hypothetical protein [bacterium]
MHIRFIRTGALATIIFLIMIAGVNLTSASFLKPSVKNNIDLDAGIVGEVAGYEVGGGDSALILVQTVINAFLSIIGVLLLIYIIYAGYNWLTAQGEEEKVTRAKETIQRAIIGVIIIVAAYAISIFVMTKIESGTLKGGDATPKGGTADPYGLTD